MKNQTGAPKIQVFILTYERPELFAESLQSVLAQDYGNFEVVVSDNSRSDATQNLISGLNDSRLIYRRRTPSLPPMQHFNQVLSEVTADYFMLFHDDDAMLPDCLGNLMQGFASHGNLVAVGGNATMVFNTFASSRKFICTRQDILIRTPQSLLRRYFISADYAPFPSYLYYKPSLGNLQLRIDSGKHADVIFLAEACLRGRILMVNTVVMRYRVHLLQDTAVCSVSDRNALVKWACENGCFTWTSPEVRFYRLNGLIEMTGQRRPVNSRLKNRLLLELAILHVKYFRLQFFFLFIRLAQRVLKKWCLNRGVSPK